MTDRHDTSSDDELISRLRAASGPERPTGHDPYLYLPIAHQVDVSTDETSDGAVGRCEASGRAPLAVPGYFDVPATEPVSCELPAGHAGPHRARFTRTRVLHRWHALEWDDRQPE